MMLTMAGRVAFLLSLPERAVRSLFALAGGGVHETAELVLPRLVRRSRLYEATAKNLLRVSIELVGGVEAAEPTADEYEPNAEAARGAQDGRQRRRARLDRGVRLLAALAARRRQPTSRTGRGSISMPSCDELKVAGVLAERARPRHGRRPARGARGRLRNGRPADRHPAARARRPAPVARRPARGCRAGSPRRPRWRRSSTGSAPRPSASAAACSRSRPASGIAFFNSARHIGRQHLLDPYGEDLKPLRDEGFGAYAARVARPYGVGGRTSLRPGAGQLDRAWHRQAEADAVRESGRPRNGGAPGDAEASFVLG